MKHKERKKIIITGGDGMIGSQANFGIKLSHKDLDILKKDSIERAINKYKPDVILHLAAMTDMLECEKNPKQAHKINVSGTENLALACKKNNVKLVYMSTGAVFGGKKKKPYNEKDTPNPLNVYGKTKLAGEKIIKKLLPNSLIIRTGWLFVGGKNDQKFTNLAFHKLKNGEEVRATTDRSGSPTYIPDLFEAIKNLIKEEKTGTYHVVNSGVASYFEIVKEIKKLGKFKTKIIPIKEHELENTKLKRAKLEALTSLKIKLRPWKVALKEYMRKLK